MAHSKSFLISGETIKTDEHFNATFERINYLTNSLTLAPLDGGLDPVSGIELVYPNQYKCLLALLGTGLL